MKLDLGGTVDRLGRDHDQAVRAAMIDGDTLRLQGQIQKSVPRWRIANANAVTIAAAILLTVILSLTIPHFMKLGNILNILEQLGILGFMAIGMTFVMVSGGIDLSTYTIVSAASV